MSTRCVADAYAKVFRLTVRTASPSDADALEGLYGASFPSGAAMQLLAGTNSRYRTEYPAPTHDGNLHLVVAENESERVAAFAMYELRFDGNLHLAELAAIPPDVDDKVRRAGTVLMLYVIEHAIRDRCTGLATLNVKSSTNADRPGDQTTNGSIAFYQNLGYRVAPGAQGYTARGEQRQDVDHWMAGRFGFVHRRIVSALTTD